MIRFPGRRTVARAVRWVRRQLDPPALVLMYHRVADLPSDPFQLAVTPDHFAQQMEVLRKRACPIRLCEATLRMSARPHKSRLPRRAVAVTFDDGYRDNLLAAKPRMQDHDIPGTVFVATGYLDKRREFWWDELERHLLTPGVLPRTGGIAINGADFTWNLGAAASYGEEDYQKHRHWHGGLSDIPGPRQELFLALHQRMRPLPEPKQRRILAALSEWTGLADARPTHRTMSTDDLGKLVDGDLIEIGAHTVTHPVLSEQAPEVQRQEIHESRMVLQDILNRPVVSFAYPYGTRDDYNADSVCILREAGFRAACTTNPGLASRKTDPFQVRRVVVRDWDGDTFERMLREQFVA